MDRIDPDQDAVDRQQFLADRVGEGLVVDDGARVYRELGQRLMSVLTGTSEPVMPLLGLALLSLSYVR
jgi:hypothetical protein